MKDLLEKASALMERAEKLLLKIEETFVMGDDLVDCSTKDSQLFRWVKKGSLGTLKPLLVRVGIRLEDLHGVDRQKEMLVRNTRQFLKGFEANNVLLWGARGTGKSSLIRALIPAFKGEGLRLIEVGKEDLRNLPEIVEAIANSPYRFILFCDDLSFEDGEPGFRDLKALLDGALSTASDRFLIYATSNRRHFMSEKVASTVRGEEIHPEEAVDEKISLSDRFGLWLPFYPFSQEVYLEIVGHWLKVFGLPGEIEEEVRGEALRWAMMRGSRNGRTAWQFAKDYAGRWKMRAREAKSGVRF